MRVLMITSEWPSPQIPYAVPFVVRQIEFLRKADIDVDVFHFRGSRNPLNYLRGWIKIWERMSKNHYDLVHAQWGQSALLALPKRLPLVITFRGDDLKGIVGPKGSYTLSGRVLHRISQWVAQLADETIVVSKELGRLLAKQSYTVIPSGLDLSFFRPMSKLESRQRLGLSVEKKLVLFTASLNNPRKRYGLAKEAVTALDDQFNIELVRVTKSPYEFMPYYMNACDVLLLTSLHEGSPNVIKEALACNLPVVSTDVGDVRERIGNVEGCVICEDDRPETITTALRQVLSQEKTINGRTTVLDLDERLLTQKVIEVYQHALEKQCK